MLREDLSTIVRDAVASLDLPEAARGVPVEITETKSPEHGDYACNFALAASKPAGMNPRQLGEALREKLVTHSAFAAVEVAGPGFLNFRLRPEAIAGYLPKVLGMGEDFAKSSAAKPLRINVEFVSVNPNGPITVGSGRGAAFGSALSNVLEAAGNEVHREYYINDGVNSEQMRLFAESVRAYAEDLPFPEKGYRGDYVQDVARAIQSEGGFENKPVGWYQDVSQRQMLERQRVDLAGFGTIFDTWFSEQSLHDSEEVPAQIEQLIQSGAADERPVRAKLKLAKGGKIEEVLIEDQNNASEDEDVVEGGQATLWLRSTKFGDDMDRVLRRKDGRLTYIASDVAYHRDKFNRPVNADKLITILGPDHHGYINRLTAVLAAVNMRQDEVAETGRELDEIEAKLYVSPRERDACQQALSKAQSELQVVIYQLVRFLKDGNPAPMRKRDGNIYELRDLQKELGERARPNGSPEEQAQAGRDVARFYYLMRSHDTTMDFDLDLATSQSDENPVFYVQYAHARICSVIAKAAGAGLSAGGADATGLLRDPKELALLKKILELPDEVRRCAEDFGVHRLTTYAQELARTYHAFYDACRVIQPAEPELSSARLQLCMAAATALRSALALLGISAPERMVRETIETTSD